MRDFYAIKRHVLGKGDINYTFKDGTKKTVNKDNYTFLTKGEQQAVARFISKKDGKPSESKLAPAKGGRTSEPQSKEILKDKDDKKIMEFIKNFQPVTVAYEEKLHIPKVFAALLSQPHTAFDQVRKYEYENKGKILLIVDKYYGYWRGEDANHRMHAALVNFTSKDKTVHHLVVEGESLEGGDYIYYTPKLLEKYDKILFISQGCGGSIPVPKHTAQKTTFITIFKEGCDCGCDRIHAHERAGCDVRYNVRDWGDLLALK